ncbi:restriction endonuclease subunit S [Desulfuromonas acetoxidans]|uniref:Type I restriction modification DNA specificity domain-containing protein n=1 Tax=Desulfuromonas acetoxidans (strain DSM 684 / 11070) TaxID=281689 RepID=Q1JWR8_DESA6|nr:restriction endonuclease subunit S [Desulfuromonas acetoxidans]EAT14726.1 protein of unknown function DUF1603 [Desulfuromonas acetoxidans DSM 684]MBF0647005.1 restriction endonuclease subunit S [Desulfuromonas acetoxidans]NVD26196.1 restriction endonuclease subunit S [Desulfuromonas acetoxidans]NVE18060.1 restriction endonuclease subunit S [Desulfuromonas acetoxidans]
MKRVDDLFNVAYGHKLDMNKMQQTCKENGIAFVGRRGNNQGVSGYVEALPDITPFPAGMITVALGGSYLLSSFVQQRPFYTAQNVAVLTPLDDTMSLNKRIYYATCIRFNRFRYSAFGREANRTISSVLIPSTVPTWVETAVIPSHEGLAESAAEACALCDPTKWSKFTIGSLFDVIKGKRLTKAQRRPGMVRFIGASEKNNGVTDLNDLLPTFPGGQLTVAYNGSVGWAFYQDKPFFACDDINVLDPKEPISKWALLFVATVLKHERTRYTYGYKWTKERMTMTPIRLPATDSGKPDWPYMESYMRGLSYSAAIELVHSKEPKSISN